MTRHQAQLAEQAPTPSGQHDAEPHAPSRPAVRAPDRLNATAVLALQRSAGNVAVQAAIGRGAVLARDDKPAAPEKDAAAAAQLARAQAIAARMETRLRTLVTYQKDSLATTQNARGWYTDAIVGVYRRCWEHFDFWQSGAKAHNEATAAIGAFFSAVNPVKAAGALEVVTKAQETAEKVDKIGKTARTVHQKVFERPAKLRQPGDLGALVPESNKQARTDVDDRDKAPTDTKGVPGVGDIAASVFDRLAEFSIRQSEVQTAAYGTVVPATLAALGCREELRAADRQVPVEDLTLLLDDLAKLDEDLKEQDFLIEAHHAMVRNLLARFWRPWPEDGKVESDLWVLWLSGIFGLRWIADAPFQNENPFDRGLSQHLRDIGVVGRLEANPWPDKLLDVAPVWYSLPDRARNEVAKPEFAQYWRSMLSFTGS